MNELINMAPVPSTNKCITTDPLIHGKLRPDPQAGHQKVTQADGWFYYLFFPLPGLDFLMFIPKHK